MNLKNKKTKSTLIQCSVFLGVCILVLALVDSNRVRNLKQEISLMEKRTFYMEEILSIYEEVFFAQELDNSQNDAIINNEE